MMRDYSLIELAAELNAELKGSDTKIERVITDSRKACSGDLFVALKGERFDAHAFVEQVSQQGASAAVVDHPLELPIAQLVVADTRIALGQLGALNRQQFSGQLVAVTGSAGKTSVKEMLAMMFSSLAPTLATQGNLNNDIGAPLTLLELSPEHQFAVIELGASAVGEIDYTAALTQPNIAILNNAMEAHVEGFGSLESIVQAKSEIYDGLVESGVGIVNLDDPHAQVWTDKLDRLNKRWIGFGLNESAELSATNLRVNDHGCFGFTLTYQGNQYAVQLSVMGRHMVFNALAALAAWVASGQPIASAIKPLQNYTGFKGRLQVHSLKPSLALIDDSYNASPSAVKAAIDTLMTLDGEHLLVLGDMAELGADAEALHSEIGRYAKQQGVDRLMATGPLMANAVSAFGEGASHFASRDELITELTHNLPKEGALLVKGSRSAAMDRVVDALIEMEK
ncbi:UDP-N-acetylmuramoyl-tripeptide--D-alanyl-D-alanine ligase [Marinobacterium sp. xm-d-564]|uniref:UDP-N-acetylmuramoyl-tripeptide--D-alanyl-D- alanine ligase n=1 Tax=Marinobacterium sp. xm-d-564 TaxID=2497742 RepID=UPI0015690CE5|nr:UDP-N-acetylmuramoyl-tripeptide--D-alanyl-D-alanine ligase [Marinobacterium sp. xm-d-564]NRP59933.1 UDP-N-acetylmuramoyl-tripeptide--D-alanyl-D-alanine ligase [Marinobacterium sp. xm-d-564]